MDDLKEFKSDVIYVDIDQRYEVWTPHFWGLFRKRCSEAVTLTRAHIKNIYVRKSSSGKIHAKITFMEPATIDVTFVIRAFLGDDPFRLAADMTRWVKFGGKAEINRIFDTKFIGGEVRKAGPWISLGLLAGP